VSESEDVADRAASMLQGLRDSSGDGERSRRRRESAEEERRKRRQRRRNGTISGSKDSADGSALSPVKEPGSPTRPDSMEQDDPALASPPIDEEDVPPQPPAIVVSSTGEQHDRRSSDGDESPDGSQSKPAGPSD
jgi:cytokinesis protein